MKNFRTMMVASGVVEASGFALMFISQTSKTTDIALLVVGVVIALAGATIAASAIFVRNKEHEVAVRYPAGDIQEVVLFESRE